MQLREALAEANEDMLFADGFDAALIGVVTSAYGVPVALYDIEACVAVLVNRDSMTEEDALEYLDYNVINAHMGENTPMFATLLPKEIHGTQEEN